MSVFVVYHNDMPGASDALRWRMAAFFFRQYIGGIRVAPIFISMVFFLRGILSTSRAAAGGGNYRAAGSANIDRWCE